MSAKPSRFPKPAVPLLAFAVAALVLFFSGRAETTPSGVKIPTNTQEYNELLRRADELSRVPLTKFGEGQTLSAAERGALKDAAPLFEAMNTYVPTSFKSYFAAGLIQHILGDQERADQYLRQSIYNMSLPQNAGEANDAKAVLPSVHFSLSLVYAEQKRWEEAEASAEAAVKLAPDEPSYRAARAAALIQLKRIDDASLELAQALRIDPNHPRSRQLAKFILTSSGISKGGAATAPPAPQKLD